MNKQEYNNVIETTVAQQTTQEDSLATTRAVLSNMGAVLPQGDLQQVSDALATDDYMGWRKCTVKEAQEYANEGTAVVAVSDDQIAVVAANDEEDEVATESSAVMTLSEDMSSDVVLYANYATGTSSGSIVQDNSNIHFEQRTSTVEVGWSGYCLVPSDCSITMTNFTSSNPQVASIEYVSGIITAHQTGSTVITAITDDGYSASYVLYVKSLIVYHTASTSTLDENGTLPEDLRCNDLSEEELKNMSWINWSDFFGTSIQDFRDEWEFMCVSLFSTGEFETVILDMIDHFMKGSGENYSNKILTEKVFEHADTTRYITVVQDCIKTLLDGQSGDIYKLKYNKNTRGNCLLVKEMESRGDNALSPVYDTLDDYRTGLVICIHSLWANKIEVKSFVKNGNSYTAKVVFTLYDHFGLDEPDVEKYGYLAGFRAWYILQHNTAYMGAYKPFVTTMQKEFVFTGTF